MGTWIFECLDSKDWVLGEYREKVKRDVGFLHKKWFTKSENQILGALRASNWLFMVVDVLMAMAIL